MKAREIYINIYSSLHSSKVSYLMQLRLQPQTSMPGDGASQVSLPGRQAGRQVGRQTVRRQVDERALRRLAKKGSYV